MTEIRVYETIDGTPALPLALKGWLDVYERGLSSGDMGVWTQQGAVVALVENGRDLVSAGVITYYHDAGTRVLHVGIGFVVEEYRGRGLYREMWNEVVAQAVRLRCRRVDGNTSVRNTAMRAVFKRLGRAEVAVISSFDVEGLS